MRVLRSIFPVVLLFLGTFYVGGQNRCLSPAEAAKVVASFNPRAQPAAADLKDVRKELLSMQKEHAKLSDQIMSDYAKNQSRVSDLDRLGETNLTRVCEILKQNGWPNKDLLKEDGAYALRYLIASNRATNLQRELMPVLVEAAKKGDIPKPVLADLVDTIRVGSGVPQIFGTQATRRGDVLYILPLANDDKVDDWRKEYGLMPLADQIRSLERRFLLPVLRSQRRSAPGDIKAAADASALGISDADAEIKVETKIVNLNVRVFTRDLKTPFGVSLTRDDFTILEDGIEQETEFFSSETAPFDLVLLLDFSGSTSDKRNLIKKAARRFVEVARPGDRVSVITFADAIKTASDLTSDKASLYAEIDKIKTEGGSAVWDALKFAGEKLKTKTPGRRSAIVFMTDGFDNASQSTFADAMENVRHGDMTVFSVYINTLEAKPSNKDWAGRTAARLEATLSMLADETGGQFYKAKDLKDLNGIYEQVVNDIGRTYGLGYESKNDNRNGDWRSLVVKLKNKPELMAKTRLGYYAN